MTFRLEMNLDNAAFEPCPGVELARILLTVADAVRDLEPTGGAGLCRDINGNTVGKWNIWQETPAT